MSTHTLAEAQDHLPDLIDRALRGEGVVITRDGQPAVELRPVTRAVSMPPTKVDIDWVIAHRIPVQNATEDAGAFVSRMRDEDWR